MRKLLVLVLLLHHAQAMEGKTKEKFVFSALSDSTNTVINDIAPLENGTSITITENYGCQLFCFYLPSPSMRREGC